MNADTLRSLVHTSLAKALGWTLFHSLWEGAIIAAMLVAALAVIRSSRARYAASCFAMLVMVVAFICTFVRVMPLVPGSHGKISGVLLPALADDSAILTGSFAGFSATDLLPWLTPVWIAGVVLFHLRGLASWMATRRLRNRGTCLAPDVWQDALVRLQTRLRLSKPVALLESALAEVPVVIGSLRPAILVPVGLLAGLPPGQIEAILIHELAHIRRHDYLINLLQTAVEGFLFYHPAIWWISNVIRTERENCCDDLVVAMNGNAPEYAAALTTLELTRQAASAAALAATGGHLMKRIRRLLYPLERPRAILTAVVSVGILSLTGALALMAWQAPQAPPSAATSQSQSPNVDVPGVFKDRESKAVTVPSANHEPSKFVIPARIPTLTNAVALLAQATQTQQPAATSWTDWINKDVVYIITDAERKAFTALQTDEERANFVEQFWERRNPTPGSPDNPFRVEQYRRIVYANAHFGSKTSVPGWKTDRGRIYIMFGPPDEIDEHSSGGTFERPATEGGGQITTLPFEDWRYRFIQGIGSDVSIEFVDSGKNGEYHMTMDPNEKDAIRSVRPQ
ncbi:MAG TPA: GWxTD domain-containing protein [Bryobacteraceae bacterium]|nr:GWxTD domain-containing protein [Bryobacteraceae bacterium]